MNKKDENTQQEVEENNFQKIELIQNKLNQYKTQMEKQQKAGGRTFQSIGLAHQIDKDLDEVQLKR